MVKLFLKYLTHTLLCLPDTLHLPDAVTQESLLLPALLQKYFVDNWACGSFIDVGYKVDTSKGMYNTIFD
jgi:hypothetical protein